MDSIIIRVARESDAPAICAIYRYYVENTTVSFRYAAPDVAWHERNIRETLRFYPYFVAERDGAIAGFAYAEPARVPEAYRWNVETTIYLSPDCPKRQGLGTRLYQTLLSALTAMGMRNAYAGVVSDNTPSLALHRSLGFEREGCYTRTGYKFGAWRDVVWLRKTLGSFDGAPGEPRAFWEDEEDEGNEDAGA